MTLEQFFQQTPRAAVAFSGGTDSALVLWAAKTWGCQVRAYYVNTAFQPAFELADAKRLAEEVGVPMTVVEVDVMAVPEAAANGPRRCYYCKRALFTALWQAARADGHTVLLDGTNASDDAGDRPGMQALRELEVRSPLRECGITKDEVRRLSREAGLFTWDKPAYACLATRVPTGTAITGEALAKVERGEDALFKLGFTDFRLRLLGDAARIQMPADQMERAAALHEQITRALGADFSVVLLDLGGR
ncbi:ATP-dependent sacrificial sulfur transferase LarE [Pseudoflavonifractor phocaeensis]|uniref:ATP-dependent sacrificial sulfur transferase LarE n=1 Tax=Pseudoflavonifractor phocaeensis TaxID=1870988 RepID=UPI00195DA120|nr:ATP-dependent sacrificial sulfur transferase LarE [Pseudoflavonifractor phocaeensis]MBM6924527.1 ATP-dependent sacrificial sulfur transferase LarE [Pseudoflavonifractor phocaeensis]